MANVNVGINGNKTLIQGGTGSGQLTVRYVPTAVVGSGFASATVNVAVQSVTTLTSIDDVTVVAQVNAIYQGSATIYNVTVDLPPAATIFVYDPTVTQGSDPATTSAASSITPALFLLFCLLGLLFF